jgi:hypothetical protein
MSTKALVQIDATGDIWEGIVNKMLAHSEHIIVLHGAGSFNGISIADANSVLRRELIPRVENCLGNGKVSIVFDGDNDDPAYPDIGHIMGRLRDHFDNRADFYAVQMLSWYHYHKELPSLRALHSASGNEYHTVLFPEKKFPGDHDHFSQHVRLTRSYKYEQWYVGACGLIAERQLADFSQKVAGSRDTHRAVIFRLPVSREQEAKIKHKLATSSNEEHKLRLRQSLARREQHPYGLLCTPSGNFIAKPEYRNLKIYLGT